MMTNMTTNFYYIISMLLLFCEMASKDGLVGRLLVHWTLLLCLVLHMVGTIKESKKKIKSKKIPHPSIRRMINHLFKNTTQLNNSPTITTMHTIDDDSGDSGGVLIVSVWC